MSTADHLAVLKLLVKGRPPAFVAEATGLTQPRVQAIADANGWPNREKLADALTDLMLDEMSGQTIPARAPDPTPPPSRPALKPATSTPPAHAPVPGGTLNGSTAAAPTVEHLAAACKRSESKRTQALGVKLGDLAGKVTAALRDERLSAEAKAKRAEERTAAQAEVKRLEKALAEARAKAVAAGAPGGIRPGARTCEVCGDQLANAQALGAHKRHKHGIASTRTQEPTA